MSAKNIIKLWNITGGDQNLHDALVHAYYHLLRWERGRRMSVEGEKMYGANEFSVWWDNYAEEHFDAFLIAMIPIELYADYLGYRADFHLERRIEKMFRTPEENRPSYPKAEAAAKRARRKLNARYN